MAEAARSPIRSSAATWSSASSSPRARSRSPRPTSPRSARSRRSPSCARRTRRSGSRRSGSEARARGRPVPAARGRRRRSGASPTPPAGAQLADAAAAAGKDRYAAEARRQAERLANRQGGSMPLRCLVVRGLVKEVEEDLNKFLANHSVNVLHMAQSEHGEYISITLLYEELAPIELMRDDEIRIENARAHNLKGVSCRIPVGRMTVVSGVSGSGKSSLAFDTLYAEGQRRYVASLSTYARQFLERLPRPEVDAITQPAAGDRDRAAQPRHQRALDGRHGDRDPRPPAPAVRARRRDALLRQAACGPAPWRRVTERLLERYAGARVTLSAPLPRRRGRDAARAARAHRARRLRAPAAAPDGSVRRRDASSRCRRCAQLRGRRRAGDGPRSRSARTRARASPRRWPRAFAREGELRVADAARASAAASARASPATSAAAAIPTPEPALFSFNSPLGACEACHGFGRTQALDLERVVPDPARSLAGGAIAPFQTPSGARLPARPAARREGGARCRRDVAVARAHATRSARSWWRATAATGTACAATSSSSSRAATRCRRASRSRATGASIPARAAAARACGPRRSRCTWAGASIGEIARLSVGELDAWLAALALDAGAGARAARACSRGCARASRTAREVGPRLPLARAPGAHALGRRGAAHPARDRARRRAHRHALRARRAFGRAPRARRGAAAAACCTRSATRATRVVVVEHAPEIVRAADHVIDLGPGAGRTGGRVVAEGSVAEVRARTRPRSRAALLRGRASASSGKRRAPRARRAARARRHARTT